MSSQLGNNPDAKDLKPQMTETMRVVQSKLVDCKKEMTWVLILGNTGNGKTTLLHSLAGRSLISVRDEETGAIYLDAKELWKSGSQSIEIGHGTEAMTFIPNIYL